MYLPNILNKTIQYNYKHTISENGIETKINEEHSKDCDEYQEMGQCGRDLEEHLNLETDRIIIQGRNK